MSPYRSAEESAAPPEESECPDGDVLPVLAILWVGSAVRVSGAVSRAERFGAEPTLALLAVVLLPFAFRDAAGWWLRRRRASRRRRVDRA